MRAAVLKAYDAPLTIEEVTLDSPKEHEVRIKVEASGVCHSDLHCVQGRFPIYRPPLIPGHEAAGTVIDCGPGVTRVGEGDRVIVCWVSYCGKCKNCLRGEPMHCTGMDSRAGGSMQDGTSRLNWKGEPLAHGFDSATFAEEAVLHENSLIKIADDVPFEVAALFGCAVTTGLGAVFNSAEVQSGDSVAVIGCGGVGLNVIQGAKVAGASPIIAVDVIDSKLEAAKSFGATHVVNSGGKGAFGKVREIVDEGVDYAFEAIGRFSTQSDALRMIRKGGMAVLVGITPLFETLQISSGLLTLLGQRVTGTFMGGMVPDRDLPKYIELWREGKIQVGELIEKRGGLEDVNSALAAIEGGQELRTVLIP